MSVRTSTRHNSVDVCINAGIDRHAESLYGFYHPRRSWLCDSLVVVLPNRLRRSRGCTHVRVGHPVRPVPLPLAAMYSRRIPWAWPRVLGVWGGGSRGTRPEHAQRR
jgi:hypothetical protein